MIKWSLLRGASGIGAALTRELGKVGAKLVLAARRKDALQKIAEEYSHMLVIQTDVTDCQQCQQRFVQSNVRFNVLGADAQPTGTSRVNEPNMMIAEECARQSHQAMQNRDRDVVLSIYGKTA